MFRIITCQLLLASFFVSKTLQKCAFTQFCSDPTDLSTCRVPEKSDAEPQDYTYHMPSACPEFDNQPRCCNEGQNALLLNSFNIIKYTFGALGGGCDICGINLYRFWCHFTCNPNQSDFVSPGDHVFVQDPTDPDDPTKKIYVLLINMTVNPNTACQLFGSCKKTPYVSQVSAMGTAEGLMDFLGKNAVTEGQEQITIYYSDKPEDKGLNLTLHTCGEKFYKNDSMGYPVIANCTCNNCDDSCPPGQLEFLKEADVMEGFNWIALVILYACAVGLTVLCILYRRSSKHYRRLSSVGETHAMMNN